MLYQFQCQKEGSIFYYQRSDSRRVARSIVNRCPICGSTCVELTGREFPEVDENRSLIHA